MFDEGSATSGLNSCCGWNPSNSTVANPLKQNSDGTFSVDNTVVNYTKGNRGHGQSIFGILTNQPGAPKGISDSDPTATFPSCARCRTCSSWPTRRKTAAAWSRSNYTEKFIVANILNLPEYAGSADTHFDAVRPMNHAFVIPATYTQKQSADLTTAARVGPDASQAGVWAVK